MDGLTAPSDSPEVSPELAQADGQQRRPGGHQQATLPANAPQSMPADIASGVMGGAGGRGHHKPEVDAQSGIEALSSALGVSTEDLMARLTNGTGIQDLLDSNPEVAAQLSSNHQKGDLVDGYA